jgi:GH35 family endo-1,4-beta-xylanase
VALDHTGIDDLAIFADKTALEGIQFAHTQVEDLQALVDNPGIGGEDWISAIGCPLTNEAACQQIPALNERLSENVAHDTSCERILKISTVGAGTTNPSVGTHFYDDGDIAEVAATAGTDNIFYRWKGSSGATNPYASTYEAQMVRNRSISAIFIVSPWESGADPKHYTATYEADCTVGLTVSLEYDGLNDMGAFALVLNLHDGWEFDGVGGDDPPYFTPPSGATGKVELLWSAVPAFPAEFTLELVAPSDASGYQFIEYHAEGYTDGDSFITDPHMLVLEDSGAPCTGAMTLDLEAVAATYEERLTEMRERQQIATVAELDYADALGLEFHNGDFVTDYKLQTAELLAVVFYYSLGGYHCATQTEIGYLAGPDEMSQACAPNQFDYDGTGPDWEISLSELLRAIQFFNYGGYRPLAEEGEEMTEDGWAPCSGLKDLPGFSGEEPRYIGMAIRGSNDKEAPGLERGGKDDGFFHNFEDNETPYCREEEYCDALTTEVNSGTTARCLRWRYVSRGSGLSTEGEDRVWDWTNSTAMIQWMKDNGLKSRAHHLLHPPAVPDYVFDSNCDDWGQLSARNLIRLTHVDQFFSELEVHDLLHTIRCIDVLSEAVRDNWSPWNLPETRAGKNVHPQYWPSTWIEYSKAAGFFEDQAPETFDVSDLRYLKIRNEYAYLGGTPFPSEVYVIEIFEEARKRWPVAKLFYNEYLAESTWCHPGHGYPTGCTRNGKSDRVYHMLDTLRSGTVLVDPEGEGENAVYLPKIDGVGFETHIRAYQLRQETDTGLELGYLDDYLAGLEENLCRIVELGLNVEITEIDVQISNETNDDWNNSDPDCYGIYADGVCLEVPDYWKALSLETRRALQAKIYYDIISTYQRFAGPVNVTIWGVTDKYSWLEGNVGPIEDDDQEGEGEAELVTFDSVLLNRAYYRKPLAYGAVMKALLGPTLFETCGGAIDGCSGE